jgi:hypothetical protein
MTGAFTTVAVYKPLIFQTNGTACLSFFRGIKPKNRDRKSGSVIALNPPSQRENQADPPQGIIYNTAA